MCYKSIGGISILHPPLCKHISTRCECAFEINTSFKKKTGFHKIVDTIQLHMPIRKADLELMWIALWHCNHRGQTIYPLNVSWFSTHSSFFKHKTGLQHTARLKTSYAWQCNTQLVLWKVCINYTCCYALRHTSFIRKRWLHHIWLDL